MADATTPPPPGPNPRTLVRPADDRHLGGVCAAVARYLGVDATPIRVIWVIAAVMGPGLPAYLVAWVLIPDTDGTQGIDAIKSWLDERPGRWNPWIIVGAVALGFLWLGDSFGTGGALFPAVLIGGGLYLLLRDQEPAPSSVASEDVGAAATAGPTPLPESLIGAEERDPLLVEAERLWDPPLPEPPPPRPVAASKVTRSRLGRWALGLLLLGLGCVGLIAATTAFAPATSTVLAISLLWCGLILIVSTWFGRARGLLPVGGLLIALIVLSSMIQVPFGSGVGERQFTPASVDDIDGEGYRLLAGQLELDVRDLARGESADIEASVVAGELILLVSPDQDIDLLAHVDVGQIVEERSDARLAESEEGIDVEITRPSTGADGQATLDIEISVGVGSITIRTIEEELR